MSDSGGPWRPVRVRVRVSVSEETGREQVSEGQVSVVVVLISTRERQRAAGQRASVAWRQCCHCRHSEEEDDDHFAENPRLQLSLIANRSSSLLGI